MSRTIERLTVLVIGILAVQAAVAVPAVAADRHETAEGRISSAPEGADGCGSRTIQDRAVRGDAETRISPPGVDYWIQAGTGIVVWAPGWAADRAGAAGFRPAPVAVQGGRR